MRLKEVLAAAAIIACVSMLLRAPHTARAYGSDGAPFVKCWTPADLGVDDADLSTNPVLTHQLGRAYTSLSLWVDLTRGGAATDVTATVKTSPDGTLFGDLQSGAISGGTRTNNDFSEDKTVSGNKTFEVQYNVTKYKAMRWTFSGTGATSLDTIDVYICASAGG